MLVTLGDPIWQVTLGSFEIGWREELLAERLTLLSGVWALTGGCQPVEETVMRSSVIIEDPRMTTRRSVMSAASRQSVQSANANSRTPADEEAATGQEQQQQQQQQPTPSTEPPPTDAQLARTYVTNHRAASLSIVVTVHH